MTTHAGLRISLSPRKITIELPLRTLRTALRGAAFNCDPNGDPAYRITDLRSFGEAFLEHLGDEDEIGGTALTRAFDDALLAAIEDGIGSVPYVRAERRWKAEPLDAEVVAEGRAMCRPDWQGPKGYRDTFIAEHFARLLAVAEAAAEWHEAENLFRTAFDSDDHSTITALIDKADETKTALGAALARLAQEGEGR